MFLYGSWLPANQHQIAPLVPALVSYWRQIHVPPLIVSYAMFFLSGLSGLLELWYAGCRRSAILLVFCAIAPSATAIALGTFTTAETAWLQALFVFGGLFGLVAAWLNLKSRRLDLADSKQALTYDDVSYRCIAIGFPLLTIGVITGGLWANHAWGTYWSWDPKESMALVTWLSYAAYIHLRVHREIAAEKLAVISIAGLLLTLLTYLGFNSLGFGGLHSYGRFK
jgi:cytochrome c-type biogenesis protein CcsB